VRPEGLSLYIVSVLNLMCFVATRSKNVCSIESTLVMVEALRAVTLKMKCSLTGCDTA